eukprot:794289-Alexandrium_andersonii.AAC.1
MQQKPQRPACARAATCVASSVLSCFLFGARGSKHDWRTPREALGSKHCWRISVYSRCPSL